MCTFTGAVTKILYRGVFMKRFFALSLSLLMGMGLLSGCQSNPSETELTKVRLNEVTHTVFYAPQYAALELGFFEDEGLEIELSNGGGADKVMTAVLTGQSDIGLAGPEACVYVSLEGREDSPKIFAQLTNCDGSFLVARTDEAFDWENLRDKTIIGGRKGGMPEMTLEYVMAQNGVIPHTDAIVDTSIQFNMMAGAFTGGNGDYVALFEPTATEIEMSGHGYIVASVGEQSGEIPYTAYFAAPSYMAEHPEVIQSFTNAVTRGLEWINETDNETVAKTIAPHFPDSDIEVLTTVVGRYKDIGAWKETAVMEEESLNRLMTVMEHAGELDTHADFDSLVDNTFAEIATTEK